MSPVAAGLDGLLAVLLLLALALGMKLNARLKGLRESQAGFAAAVTELNQAAARAEAGLAALKGASESAHDDLLARIETARELIVRLERSAADAQRQAGTSAPLRETTKPSAGAPLGGTLATIAALAEGRRTSRLSEAAPPAPTPRRPRGLADDDLFEAERPPSPPSPRAAR